MKPEEAFSVSIPTSWKNVPFWALFKRHKKTGFEDEELLSVYRDYGVIPKASRDDNHNKPSEDLSNYQLVTEGALVTNKMKAWQGSIGISRHRGIVSPAYYVYEPLSREHDQFLHYLLRSQPYIDLYGRISKGIRVNQWDLEHEALRNIPILLPKFPTQRAIADFLDRETARIDQLIEKKKRLTELLKEKSRRTVSANFELLTSEHKIWRLKHVLISGLAYGANEPADNDNPSDVRYIRITDIDSDGGLRNDTFKSLPRELVRDHILEDGDILLARSGATVGKSFIYRDSMGECCYAGYLIRARVNNAKVSPDFIHLFTSTDQYWNHILGNNIQATIQNVSAEKYANLEFPLPPRDRQDAIIREITLCNDRIRLAKNRVNASISRLREFRSALITAAVTGQIDVGEWSRRGGTDAKLDAIAKEMESES
jgi:type I restriction enzyme S subunit